MSVPKENKLHSFTNKLTSIFEKVAIFGLLGITLTILIQILFRNIFNISFTWGGEFAIYMNFFLIFLGAAVVFKEGDHVSMDLLIKRANKKVRKLVDFINSILILSFVIIFLYSSISLVSNTMDVTTAAMKMPYVFFYAPTIIGFTFMLFIILKDIIANVTKEKRESE